MFDKALLLDNGGKLACFGTPSQMLDYFAEARAQEGVTGHAFEEPLPDECAKGQAVTPDHVAHLVHRHASGVDVVAGAAGPASAMAWHPDAPAAVAAHVVARGTWVADAGLGDGP